jgi:tetratricopeptide (TPR) repeat protein
MTADIALRNEWFSQLFWILPMQDQTLPPDFKNLRNQLFERKMLNEEEVTSLVAHEKVMRGKVRNTAISVSNMSGLTLPDKAVLIHIDLGYFQGLYKNEIATPLLQTIYMTLAALKKHQVKVLAVTFSYGHLDSQIPLDVRFLGDIIEKLISEPDMLVQRPPANWKRQADAIYLVNFFQGEKVDEIHKAQEQDDPESSWVKFSLYRSAASLRQGDEALDYLAEAVARDPMYAYEYGNLARLAYERKRPDEAMRMYALAHQALPEDHLIRLSMAELAAELGDHKTARHLAEELAKLPWSSPYHGEMHNYLENFINNLGTEEIGQGSKE